MRRETMDVEALVLDDEDAARMVADHERRNRFMGPIVRRVLSQLAGFTYDGTNEGHLALVRQLPVVGFSPSTAASDR